MQEKKYTDEEKEKMARSDFLLRQNLSNINKASENIFNTLKNHFAPLECILIHINCITNDLLHRGMFENDLQRSKKGLEEVLSMMKKSFYSGLKEKMSERE